MSPEDASPPPGYGDAGRDVSLAVRLPRERTAPAAARRLVRSRLDGLIGPQATDDLLLVVSELVTNAVLHGAGEIELRIAFDGSRVTGRVADEGGGFVRAAHRRPANRAGGNGLHLVGAVTTRWGVREEAGHVWFELPVEPVRAG